MCSLWQRIALSGLMVAITSDCACATTKDETLDYTYETGTPNHRMVGSCYSVVTDMLVEHAGVERKLVVPHADLVKDLGVDEYTLGGVVLNAERRMARELESGTHYSTVSDLAISLCRAKSVRRLSAGMRYIRTINGAELKHRIGTKGNRTVIDFSAEWCGPCQMIRRSLAEIASEQEGKFEIVRIDIDRTPDVAELYRIRSIPTVVLLRNGRRIDIKVGALPKQQYVSFFLYSFGLQ